MERVAHAALQRILVCTDLSEGSDVAVTNALNIARHTGAEVVALHVGHAPEPPIGLADRDEWDEVVRHEHAVARDRFDALRARAADENVKLSQRIVEGTPHVAILAAADDLRADLIVVGTRGRTGHERFMLGSVAERVLRGARTSVMLARPGHAGARGFRRILVPSDFSAPAERALSIALALASSGGVVDLVHCWSLPLVAAGRSTHRPSPDLTKSLGRAMVVTAQRHARELVERHRERAGDVAIELALAEVPAKVGIQQRLERFEYDLVALGSHSRRKPASYLLGSVAEATARHTECSVIVAHID